MITEEQLAKYDLAWQSAGKLGSVNIPGHSLKLLVDTIRELQGEVDNGSKKHEGRRDY